MSTKVPFLARLGIYRISVEKQETLLKLMVLSTAAILCEYPGHLLCGHILKTYKKRNIKTYQVS